MRLDEFILVIFEHSLQIFFFLDAPLYTCTVFIRHDNNSRDNWNSTAMGVMLYLNK